MAVYYNEIDIYAAQWLRNLIKAGHIPDGEVDTRSIVDVRPGDLRGFAQCHFFAGIAGWSHALRLAGWPDKRPIWTGSCPCQPFSVAGKGKGTDDPRHLWPAFFRLIAECRPAVVFGEQVASRAGREWLSGVLADLEGVGYAGAAADLCAAGVGAPHIRQRLYWVALADAEGEREPSGSVERQGNGGSGFFVARAEQGCDRFDSGFALHDMADAESLRRRGRAHVEDEGRREQPSSGPCAGSGDMVDTASIGRGEGRTEHELRGRGPAIAGAGSGDMADADSELRDGRGNIGTRGRDEHPDGSRSGDVADANDPRRQGRQLLPERPDELAPWSRGVEWRRGADGKERRVKSGVRLLASGVPNRVGRLRAYGNAIVPPLAAKVVKAFMESEHGA